MEFKIKIKSPSKCFCDSHRKEFWEEFYKENPFISGRSDITLNNDIHLKLERHESGPVFIFLLNEIVNNPYFSGIISNFIYDFIKLLVKIDNGDRNSIDYEISFRKENRKTKETVDSTIKFRANNIPDSDLILEQINNFIKNINN